MERVNIPSRFAEELLQHLLLNYAQVSTQPLILVVYGPPGEGKTFQLRRLLDERGVTAYSVNAADLESDRAGRPGKLILEQYVLASERLTHGEAAALVIDDIDTTVGEWTQNTGTINHQQVLAQLMHLADSPTSIDGVGRVRRVPVFFTGNDLGKVYPPLRRPGRMNSFLWRPTPGEKVDVVRSVLGDLADQECVNQLLQAYPTQPVAFFGNLRLRVLRELAVTVLRRAGQDLHSVVRQPDLWERAIRADIGLQDRSMRNDLVLHLAATLAAALAASRESYLEAGE